MEYILNFRKEINGSDIKNICQIIQSTQLFSPDEIQIAIELAEDRLLKGEKSWYDFLFAEINGAVIGYCCYGAISGTQGSFDLYWIAIHNDYQGLGLGKRLLYKTEYIIKNQGGRHIYIETSSRESYKRTRTFYRNCGYEREAILRDFYAPGDSKEIYVKKTEIYGAYLN